MRLPLVFALSFAASIFVCATSCVAQTYTVEEAPEWTSFFDTTSGWTGADGIFSFPVDGNERPGGVNRTDTIFVFSDTFIGNVNPDKSRSQASLVNNTLGFLQQGFFSSGAKYFWDQSGATPAAMVVPNTPQSQAGDWYWFADGVVIGDQLHVLAQRMHTLPGGGGAVGFERGGMALISMPTTGPYAPSSITQVDAPGGLPPIQGGRGGIFFGAGIFPNTAAAGAPNPDGFVYIYGSQEDPLVKKLVVARVQAQDFTDFSAWRYWDGANWVRDIRQVRAVTGRISNELSVTPTPSGQYALIFSLDTLSNQVAMKLADHPWGPFGPAEVLWHIVPPPGLDDIFTYNAKAHPHLSEPGELLISWNVNTFNFWDHFTYADIYRPRFIKLVWQ